MIRLLSKRPVRDGSWRSHLYHPDPDALLDLVTASERRSAQHDEIARAFSDIVSSVRVGKTHKLTRPNRLSDPTRVLCRHLQAARGTFELLDVGGSDGITTLEAVRDLEAHLRQPVRACLIDPFIRLRRYRSGRVVEYRTPDQSPVMVRVGRCALQLSSLDTSRDVVSRTIGYWYLSRESFRREMAVDATIPLVNPIVSADPRLVVREGNILLRDESLVARFDAARASNVLNRSYFSAEQVADAAAHLHAYLRPGGFLLVSRSRAAAGDVEIDHGAIWRRAADRFEPVETFGDSSEVADLIGAFRVEPRRAHA